MKILLSALLGCAILNSCSSSGGNDKQRIAIHSRGMASLENTPAKDMSPFSQKIIYFVGDIDGKRPKALSVSKVIEISAGRRVITATSRIVDPKLGGMNVRQGSVKLSFAAKPRLQYKLVGRTDGNIATMWIRDVSSNKKVSSESSTRLVMRKTRMVPIPVGL